MKIVMTNDEWHRASWFHRAFAVMVGNIVMFSILGALILLALIGWSFLTAIPLRIYLAAIIVILLIVVFRRRRVEGQKP